MLQRSPNPARYTRVAVILHWSVALLVTVIGIIGLTFKRLPTMPPGYWVNLHAVLGLLFLSLVLARILYRIGHKPPDLPGSVGAVTRTSAQALHAVFYVLMLIIAALGLVAFIWHARVFEFALFAIDLGVVKDRTIYHPAQDFHRWFAYGLFALIALHVAAALWHVLVKRDGVLRRMSLSRAT